jgi:hypothetical protein
MADETSIDLLDLRKSINQDMEKFDALIQKIQEQRDKIRKDIESRIEQLQLSKYDKEELANFFKEPYCIIPKRENEYYIIAPKWVNFQIGWLDRQTKSFNIFVVNRYLQWIAQIPSTLREKLKFPEPLPLKVFDGVVLTGKENQEKVWNKYGKFLSRREGNDRIKIKNGAEFKLLAQLIEDGILPFIPKPIEQEDTRDWSKIELRTYQKDAWLQFMERGALGVYWGFGAGKSLFGVYALARIKGRKLVIVPTLTLKEQWEERIVKYIPEFANEVEVVTYHAFEKCRNKEYALIEFDECLTGDTLVILNDGGIKEIKSIENDECVVGGLVKGKFKKYTNETIKIHTGFGILETTKTHPHLIVRRTRDKHNNQWFKIKEADVNISFADFLKQKDMLLIPETIPHTQKNNWSPKQLAFVALIACDGHIEKNNNTVKVSIRKQSKSFVRQTFIDGINSFGINKFWEFTNKRGDYTIGCCTKKIKEVLMEKFQIPEGKKANKIDINNEIFYAPMESIRSFIALCFSCDGWVRKETNNSKRAYFSVASKSFVIKLQLLLKKLGIHSYFLERTKKNPKHNKLCQINIGGFDFNKLCDTMVFPREEFNSIGTNKGKNNNDAVFYKGKQYRLTPITKIERIKSRKEVFDFTSTGTNTFLANGFLTHNCHHLPADSFIRLATLKTKYRLGFSGSPFREDHRENYIFALTGFPVGMSWDELLKSQIIKTPTFRLYLLEDNRAKMKKIGELLKIPVKTLIFCDSLDFGKKISDTFEIPFVYSQTKDRLDVIREANACVVSRVGDEGISIPEIERVIEVSFLFGSRMQESQRFGRLMHSQQEEPEHTILMTEEEFEKYNKRLYAITERGFKIEILR